MSFHGATALRPQTPSPLAPNNLDGEESWARYFSDLIDNCQFPEGIDHIYQHWADCINLGDYTPPPSKLQTLSDGSYYLIMTRAASIPAPPPATPKPPPSALRSIRV